MTFRSYDQPMSLPYKISTLLYVFDPEDRVLLLHRKKEPNQGLWSPCGGKLQMDTGESPYACACRELHEETGFRVSVNDLHLTGLASEHGYAGQAHWLMFLFEIKPRFNVVPPEHEEGIFAYHHRRDVEALKLPQTDRESLWPLFWSHRGGFFAAHCHCHADGTNDWTVEETA
jgi:8-oxo-dGTP diphosphatase